MPPKAPPVLFRQIMRLVPFLHTFDIVIGTESGIAFALAATNYVKNGVVHSSAFTVVLHHYQSKMGIYLTKFLFAQMHSCSLVKEKNPLFKRGTIPNESIEVIPSE